MAYIYEIELLDSELQSVVKYTTAQISSSGAPRAVQTPYEASRLFTEIRNKKTVNVTIEPGNQVALHSFMVASKNQQAKYLLEITLIQRDYKREFRLETLSLVVHVKTVNPAGSNSYVASSKVLDAPEPMEFDDKSLDYLIGVYYEVDEKKRNKNWDKDSDNKSPLVGFVTKRISVPTEQPVNMLNEPKVGRLFQSIQRNKVFSVQIGSDPGPFGQDVPRTFMEANRDKTTIEMSIELRRAGATNNTLAKLRLAKVQVRDFVPIKNLGYEAKLKVLGNADGRF